MGRGPGVLRIMHYEFHLLIYNMRGELMLNIILMQDLFQLGNISFRSPRLLNTYTGSILSIEI